MELECTFVRNNWKDGNRYTCCITSTSFRKPRTAIKAFNGVHENGMADKDVTAVWFFDTVVEFFPLGLKKIFPNLNAVEIKNCGLKKISRSDLASLENLVILSLPDNKLTSLPDDLLKQTRNLEWIYFQNNQLRSLSMKLFEPLNKATMKKIDFTGNPSINAFFTKAGELSLKALMENIKANCGPPVQAEEIAERMEFAFEKLKEFQANGKFTDFTIKVKDKEFKVHKAVLASQSSVFEKMLTSGKEQGEQISKKIKNFSVETFEEFLDYFYSGKVRTEVAMELFELAVEFDAPALKIATEENILENLDESNALEVYNLAHERLTKVLKRGAFGELMIHFPVLDESMLDEIEIVNDLVEARRRLEELERKIEEIKRKK